MHIFLLIFLFFITLYHGIATRVTYGSGRTLRPGRIALVREGIWFLGFFCIALFNAKKIRTWLLRFRKIRIFVALFIGYSIIVSFFFLQKTPNEIVIGLKSSILPFIICISGIIIGWIQTKNEAAKTKKNNPRPITTTVLSLLIFIVIGGILRQGAKHIFPDFFLSLGFGPVGDRHFAEAPPLYYRTGPGGRPRFSGLFAGPNNYAYFLILFFPFVIDTRKRKQKTNKRWSVFFLLYILSGVCTLSRGLFLAWGAQVIFLGWNRIKQYKKITGGLLLVGIACFVGVSIYKSGSTSEHILRRGEGIRYILEKPFFGWGLGTSGPAAHHSGEVIPENMYFQIIIDTGLLGFFFRGASIRMLGTEFLRKREESTNRHLFGLGLGVLGIAITGFFLHIFEDSMVNYLFFIVLGILLGQKQAQKTPQDITVNSK